MLSIRYNRHLWQKAIGQKMWECKYCEWTFLSIYKNRFTNLFNVMLTNDNGRKSLSSHKTLKKALCWTKDFMSIKQKEILECISEIS